MNEYNFRKIEQKWQKVWAKEKYGQAQDFSKKPKHYHLVEFPYPSGEGLHIGHCMAYTASDTYCRMKRMQGYEILFPMGWDAFGLPTENFAIQNKIKPQDATKKNVANYRRQMNSLGYSFDWSREINTTDPNYYKWTQWIFLQFYRHGVKDGKLIEISDDDKATPRLAYQAEMPVNWCPSCKINLANEEVVAGNCERCGTPTQKRLQKQWLLRITAYADRLIDDLQKVDYQEEVKRQQVNWIGRSSGANVKFKIDDNETIEVFTTRADTLFGCTYVVLAPEHPLIKKLKAQISNLKEVEEYIDKATRKSDLERAEIEKEKTGVELKGIKATNPINNKKIPVWMADYVLLSYGTGACMAVPAHDQRDWDFAKKYNITIHQVIKPNSGEEMSDKAFVDYGILINSTEFDGLTSKEAQKKITEKLKKIGAGDFAVNYKLRDWIFSRQHYWGEPIPIIHCPKDGVVPLDKKDLPLELPEVEAYEPSDTGESPLAKISDWVNTKCPNCGGHAKRETDTMPNWAGSSWYFIAYALNQNLKFKNQNDGNIFIENRKGIDFWLPVDIYNGGAEHITLHLLYSRFWHKFLYDLKVAPGHEPYQKRITHGLILGPDNQKMSKSRGNVINPDKIIEQFGADTLRAYIMFIGPYDQESAWNMAGAQGVFRFLNRVWKNAQKIIGKDSEKMLIKLNQTINSITKDLESFNFNTVISKLMELNNTIEKEGISKQSFSIFLKLLFPACPHIAEELWEKLGFDSRIENQKWPEVDKKYLIEKEITIAVQINGKTRGTIKIDPRAPQSQVVTGVKEDERLNSLIDEKSIKKVIFVAGRVINFVIE